MTPHKILIVDDEERIQEVVQMCLEMLNGWQVLTAGSGQEALHQAVSDRPEAILLDVSMPDMDGFSVLHELQTTPLTQAIPVIFLTAKVQPADHSAFAKSRIAGVIHKPFDPVTLASQICELLHWD